MAKPSRRSTAIFRVALCATLAGTAWAQASTWRCGNTYTDQPCPGGQAVAVDDARSPAAQRASEMQAREAGRHAAALARERQALEARSARQGPAVIARPESPFARPAPRADKGVSKPTLRKPKKPRMDSDAFTAHGSSSMPTTKKKRL